MEADKVKWFVIVNPVAGGGRGLDHFPQISKLLRDAHIVCEPVFTEHKFHATELTVSAVKEGYRNIIVVGGDGTLHEVVNGLFIQQEVCPDEVLLAVIAVGTGNDWVRTFGISNRYQDAVKAIGEGYSFLQDVGVVSYEESHYRQSRYMANVAGAGFDARMVRKLSHLKKKGRKSRWRSTWCLVKNFFRYKSTGVKVWVDDRLVYNNLLFSIAIGICKYNVGGMQQLPDAVADDGMQEHVRGLFAVQLLRGFQRHGQITLHDPQRDLLVARPRRVLHQRPAVLRGGLAGQFHRAVVIELGDRSVGARPADVLEAFGGAALGHVDDAALLQLRGRPGHAAAVVAVGGGDEGGAVDLRQHFGAGQLREGQRIGLEPEAFGDAAAKAVAAAEHFESVEAEAAAFVLDAQRGDPQFARQARQIGQRRGRVLGKAAVEGAHLLGLSQAELFRRRGIEAGAALVMNRLEQCLHFSSSLNEHPRALFRASRSDGYRSSRLLQPLRERSARRSCAPVCTCRDRSRSWARPSPRERRRWCRSPRSRSERALRRTSFHTRRCRRA